MAVAKVRFFSQDISYLHQNKKKYYKWINDVVEIERKSISFINVIFSNDEHLFNLNTDYLKHDTYTDVISFQYDKENIEGDIYISIDRVKENAQLLSIPFQIELARVIIHGVLHFCGHLDGSEKEKQNMRLLENRYLSLLFP